MRVNKSMPVSDRHQHRDGSNVASCDDEYLKGSLAGGMQMDRRTFTAWLLAAPFVMKAGLAAAPSDKPAAGAAPAHPHC